MFPSALAHFFHFPYSHGGGKRCKIDGCHKSAVGGSLYCTGHGGGKRCSVPGCDKSAQSSTKFCVKHGGGKKCQFEGCKKVARGKTLFCAAVSYMPTALAFPYMSIADHSPLLYFSMVGAFDVSWRDATVLLSERHNYAEHTVVAQMLVVISVKV